MSIAENVVGRKFKDNKITPYPYQKVAIDSILEELKVADRATIIMPWGTGKTLICLWVAEKIATETVVVFVPSLALIHQAALKWVAVASKPLNIIAVCSDQPIEKNKFWLPVLNDPKKINRFLQEESNEKEIKVVFCTYQSSLTLARAARNFKFDFGICKEAHLTMVDRKSYFSAPLFDEYVTIKKRLFVTATPGQLYLNKKDKQDELVSALSMDNVKYYGKHCYISDTVFDKLSNDWDKMIGKLTWFKKQYGHCNTSQKFNSEPALIRWVYAIRRLYKQEKLGQERIQQLQHLEFNWNPRDTLWNKRIAELMKFKKQYGSCNVSNGFSANPTIANWVIRVRQLYKNRKLTQERIQRLEGLGFDWRVKINQGNLL